MEQITIEELERKSKASAMECRPDDAGPLPRKIKVHGAKWEQLARNEALAYAPSTYPCAACEYPVLKGFCCGFCQTMNPEGV
jgi:hypothetical protein